MDNRFKDLWITETIRLIEQQSGYFADIDINRQASSLTDDSSTIALSKKIIFRADKLAKKNGLHELQKRWLTSSRLAFFILILCAIMIGVSLSFTALSQQPVNVFWALISLLGLHIATLVIWLFGFFFMPNESSSILTKLWLWGTKKLTTSKIAQQFLPALLSLLGQKIKWGIGYFVNLFWSIILLSALATLFVLLSTKHYSFVWQTTLLNADTFIFVTQTLGHLPALFGFNSPDIDTIRQSGELAIASGDARSTWAVWLVGVFIFYGVLIRLSLTIIFAVQWYIAKRQIQLDLTLPDYQLLATRLQPTTSSLGVIDKENKKSSMMDKKLIFSTVKGERNIAVALDVDEKILPTLGEQFIGCLNDREQRKKILDHLQLYPAKKLLIIIDTDRAPDRGIVNTILDLAHYSETLAVSSISQKQGKQYQNWQDKLTLLNIAYVDFNWLSQEQVNA